MLNRKRSKAGRVMFRQGSARDAPRLFANTLLADDRLKAYHPIFRQRWAHAHTTLGIGLIRDRKPAEACPYLWRSLLSQFKMRTFVALIVSYLPYALARRF